MEKNTLEFECIGIKNEGKIPVENTGRGKDISPEFIYALGYLGYSCNR